MSIGELREVMEDLPTELRPAIIQWEERGDQLSLQVDRESLPALARYLLKKYQVRLLSEHVADERKEEGCFILYLVLSLPKGIGTMTCLVEIDPAQGSFPSLTPDIPAANWFEREVQDLFGLTAEGHPDPRPLVLYDDWPADRYPLRKDFDILAPVPRERSPYTFKRVEGEGIFEIPVGPVHAGVIEPGHFRFSVAGEPVINLELRLGYVHRGVEKLSESLRYDRGVLLAERISGDNGFSHALAYCQTVEGLASAQVPERALYLRTVFSELERLYNHMGDVAGIVLDTAYTPGAQMAYLIRERLMDLNESVSGSRLLRSVNCLGGVRKDIDHKTALRISAFLVKVKLDFNDFKVKVLDMPSFLDRTETTGILSLEAARQLMVVGPVARGSGIDIDARRDHPYAAYRQVSFNVPVHREGDVQARFMVKCEEVYESISIIEQALDQMPSGPIVTTLSPVPAMGTCFSLVESHRGELMHWVLSGEERPHRHKVRDASFMNWPALEVAVPGNIVPDFPLINKSFNLSYAGNDL
jgi:Ni,Fe-hydrogenase III large subunit/Ni,Fe-hydrogenase III component G